MSYKPAQSGVPNGIVYFGNSASDNVFEAESAFAYNPSTNTLNVDNFTVDVDASVGGNISVTGSGSFNGDVTILGDLNVSGVVNRLTVNLQELLIEDHSIVLNSNVTGDPGDQDASIIVNRGSLADVQIRWDEGDDLWEFTNDGTNYYPIPIAGSGMSYRSGSGPEDLGSIVDLDLNDLPVETTATNDDYIAIVDVSDSNVTKKITRSNLLFGLGAMSDFIVSGDLGSAQTIGNGDNLILAGGSGIITTASSLDTVTLDIKVDDLTVGINGSDQVYVKNSGINTDQLADASVTEAKLNRTINTYTTTTNITHDIALASGLIQLTLPPANSGKMVFVKRIDNNAGSVVVKPSGTQQLDGASEKRLYYQYESLSVVSDGANWFLV